MTFVDRFTDADGTNLHGRTPAGAGAAYNVVAGSWSIQGNAAQSGAANSEVLLETGITNLIYSVVVSPGSATYSHVRFRWDEAGGTGWIFDLTTGNLFYWDGDEASNQVSLSYNLRDNGNQWYIEVDLRNPASISLLAYNLQFSGFGWQAAPLVASSTLNNDKTAVGIATSDSGIQFDNLRCQEGAWDYPYQGLHEARVQRGIVQEHVSYIIASYDTGTPARTEVYGENNEYSPYYDGPSALLQLYDLWGPTDGALFYEAAWKQQSILNDDYYEPNNYAAPGYKHFSRGPYRLWGLLADQDNYDAVRYFPTNASFAASADVSKDYTIGEEGAAGLHRECAYALAAHVWAHKIGGVAASELNTTRWDELREDSYDWVNYWCDEVSPGVYPWTGTGRQVAAFQIFLMARSLWDDYTVSEDSRFPAALLKLCNFVWDNFWLSGESPPALDYDLNPDSPSYESVAPNNDLNMLGAAAYAKCAQLTGNQTHMDRADALFAGSALYGDFSSGGKQKNQQTTWLKDYIDWRAEFYAPPTVRRSGRLFRRSAA